MRCLMGVACSVSVVRCVPSLFVVCCVLYGAFFGLSLLVRWPCFMLGVCCSSCAVV